MAKVKIKLNKAGVGALLKSSEMQALLSERAEAIKTRAGEGYESDTHMTPSRVIASVYTGTPEAMKDNLDNNTLLKAVK